MLRRGAQHLLVALIIVSADEFWSFWCQFIGVFPSLRVSFWHL